MSDSANEILARVCATGDATLSAAEIAALTALREPPLLACRLLSMHYFKNGDFPMAAAHARTTFDADPSAETAKNLLSALNRSRQFDEALAHTRSAAKLFDPIELAEGQCTTCVLMGDLEEAVRHGTRALVLKDAQSPAVERPEPVTHTFNPTRPERNVISFSLFGAAPRYTEGAIRNAMVARHLYPGWTPRYYVDDSVPEDVVRRLQSERAQIRKAPKLDAARYGLFWRMLVEDDPEVDIYIVRDCDSVLNIKERAAVQSWLDSGAPYHVMRDHPIHCELILAGMWGAHRGNLQPMGKRILEHARAQETRLNDRTTDQIFLRNTVWPLIRRDALVHDSWFQFRGSRPYPEGFSLTWPDHIGRNEFSESRK